MTLFTGTKHVVPVDHPSLILNIDAVIHWMIDGSIQASILVMGSFIWLIETVPMELPFHTR